jgi:hypothetical protein
MKAKLVLGMLALAGAALALPVSQAQAQAATGAKVPVYTPPSRGAPQRRVGGSSRGIGATLPNVMLLVPDHVALTVSETPSLYWYLSKPTSVRVEVTLIDDKGESPLVEYAISNADGPAVHRIDLASRKIALKPGVEYQWSIAVVPDPNVRSSDVMAGGALKRVEMPQKIAARRAAGASNEELAGLYAAEGIWYDAIALYSELIEQRPRDKVLRESRAALLDQVGLKEIAAFDRKAAQ